MVLPAKNKVSHEGKLCQHMPKMFNAGVRPGEGPISRFIRLDPSLSRGQKKRAGGAKRPPPVLPVEALLHDP